MINESSKLQVKCVDSTTGQVITASEARLLDKGNLKRMLDSDPEIRAMLAMSPDEWRNAYEKSQLGRSAASFLKNLGEDRRRQVQPFSEGVCNQRGEKIATDAQVEALIAALSGSIEANTRLAIALEKYNEQRESEDRWPDPQDDE